MKLVCRNDIELVSQKLKKKDPHGIVTIFNLKGEVVINKPIAELNMHNGNISINGIDSGRYLFVWHINRQTEVQVIEVTYY